jgi:hypothetical protein
MSGLLERIVRRRRASASSRLGPPAQNGQPSPYEGAYLNGHASDLPVTHVNGSVGATDVPDAVEETEDRAAPEAVEVPVSAPEVPEGVDDPEAEDLDEPAVIEDESPTMEHRVLVLEESGPEPAPSESHPGPEALSEPLSEPGPPSEPRPPEPHFRGRARIRRRARYLRRLRELQLRDIGGFALELHRFGRERPDLLQAKIADAAQTDAEVRALEQALNAEEPLRELREAGIGGVCGTCGAVHGSEDHFCATCGEPVGRNSEASQRSGDLDDLFGRR